MEEWDGSSPGGGARSRRLFQCPTAHWERGCGGFWQDDGYIKKKLQKKRKTEKKRNRGSELKRKSEREKKKKAEQHFKGNKPWREECPGEVPYKPTWTSSRHRLIWRTSSQPPQKATDEHQHKPTEAPQRHKTTCRETSHLLIPSCHTVTKWQQQNKVTKATRRPKRLGKNIFPLPTWSLGTICTCNLKHIQEITELML